MAQKGKQLQQHKEYLAPIPQREPPPEPRSELLEKLKERGRFSMVDKAQYPSVYRELVNLMRRGDKSNIAQRPDWYIPDTTYVMYGVDPSIGYAPYGTSKYLGAYRDTNDTAYIGADTTPGYDPVSVLGHEAAHAQQYRSRRKSADAGKFYRAPMDAQSLNRWERGGWDNRVMRNDIEAAQSYQKHPDLEGPSFYPQRKYEEIYAILGGLDAALPAGQRLYDSVDAQSIEQLSPGLIDSYYKQAYAHKPGYTNREPTWKEWLSDLISK